MYNANMQCVAYIFFLNILCKDSFIPTNIMLPSFKKSAYAQNIKLLDPQENLHKRVVSNTLIFYVIITSGK